MGQAIVAKCVDAERDRRHLYASRVQLRGSVLGLGSVGRHHARILETSPRVELVGAVEVNGADAGLPAARIHRSWEGLRAHADVDFAIVALPTALHEAASLAVAADGAHILVEKPLALSQQEARSIVDACGAANVHGAVAHIERYNPALVELKRLLAAGQIGRPVAIASERAGPLPPRAQDTGVISDLATHDLDLIPWLVNERIEFVFTQTEHLGDVPRHEHVAAITGRLSGGIVFNTMADWLSQLKMRRVRVLGDEGSLLADLIAPRLLHIGREVREVPLTPIEPLMAQFDSFCDLLEGRTDAQVASLADGLSAVASADAAVRSAREGQPITL
jgi:predicted dehydrogenase